MSLQHWLLLVLIPLALGVVVFVFRQNPRAQLTSIAMGAAVHAALLWILEVIPEGGLRHHGNTWEGYALIELGPFVLVLGVVAALRFLRPLQRLAVPVVVAVSVPVSYWAGLFVAVSLAVAAGLATP